MVRAKDLLFAIPLSFVAASDAHGPFTFPWDRTDAPPPVTAQTTQTPTIQLAPQPTTIYGDHHAYLRQEILGLNPTTFLTLTTAEQTYTTETTQTEHSTKSQEHSRRQLGLLGGLLGGVQGLVTGLVGGLQPAVSAALAPIQSAANTNLAQVSLIQSLAPNLVPSADVAGPAASAVNPVLGNLLGGLLTALAPIIQGVGSAAAGPVEGLAAPLESALAAPLQAAVGPLVSALAPAVAAALSPAKDAVGGLIQPIASNLLDPIESAVAPLLGGVVGAAVSALAPIENPLASALQPLLGVIDSAILPLASDAVAAVWPAIAPIITPLNPVICALQPAEVPVGTDVTALIPVQCVSVASGNMIPVSTGLATVISPQGLLSITPATLVPPMSTVPLPMPGILGLPTATPATTITAPGPTNAVSTAAGLLGSNPVATAAGAATGADALSSAAGIVNSSHSGPPVNTVSNPLGAAAAAASSLLAGLATQSNKFGVSLSAPQITSNAASPSAMPTIATSSSNVAGEVSSAGSAVTSVLTALPVAVPASSPAGPSCTMMQPGSMATAPPANLPNIPFLVPNSPVPTSPWPVNPAVPATNFPPVGGTVAAPSPAITAGPLAAQGGLIMLAYGSQTITFAASQLPGGALVANVAGEIYAFPASAPAPVAGKRRRDLTTQPDYQALAAALVSLLRAGQTSSDLGTESSTSSLLAAEALSIDASVPAPASNASVSDRLSAAATSSTALTTSLTTNADASASGASLAISSCPDINGTSYLSSGGSAYHIICGTNWPDRDIQPWRSTTDFDSCVAQCDALNAAAQNRACAAALFVPDAPSSAANCYPKYSVDNPTNVTGGYTFQAAVLQSSGMVVDNGFGAPAINVEQVAVPKQDVTNLTGSSGNRNSNVRPTTTTDVIEANVLSSLPTSTNVSSQDLIASSGTETAASSIQTLDLTSLTTLGGLNISDETLPANAFGTNVNGLPIVYAMGTQVILPVLSTTLKLGPASNLPATDYFPVTSTASVSGLAKRDLLALDPSPHTPLPLPTFAPANKRGFWLPGAPPMNSPTPGPTVISAVRRAGWLPLPAAGGPSGAASPSMALATSVYSKRQDIELKGLWKGFHGPPYEIPKHYNDVAKTIWKRKSADLLRWSALVQGAEKDSQGQVKPDTLSPASKDRQAPAGKRDVTDRMEYPYSYAPTNAGTGANFALAEDPIDSGTGGLSISNSTGPTILMALSNVPHFSRDGGKGGMIGNQHVFTFADTAVYSTEEDGSNGHFIGFVSSSVATDVGQHGLFGNSLALRDGIGEYADSQGSLRGYAPFTTGETGWNEQAVAAGVSSRYAIWPESSFIPLTANRSIMIAPLVYDVVDNVTKSADFTYTGNTLLSVSIDEMAGPVAQRLVGRLFNATDVEWGCVGGIRSWGPSGVGGNDGQVYLFGNVRGGLLMARTNVAQIADIGSYQYWGGNAWTAGSLVPDSTAYVLEGSFMDIDVFYSPRHLTFIAVYTNIYGDNTVYWRYLEAPQALLPSFAGGDPDSDIVEALTDNKWSDEHILFKMGAGLNGDYSYAMGVHLGYFGGNDIVNGGEKMLLSWTSPTGQDAASRNSAYQIMNGIVTWA